MKKIKYLGLVAVLANPAFATTYKVELIDYPVKDGVLDINKHAPVAGYVDNFTSSFNTETEQLKVSMKLLDTRPASVSTTHPEYDPKGIGDGFWLVLSEGPGPQSTAATGKYTILIGDKESKKVNSYVYRPTEDKTPLTEINLLDQQHESFIQSFDDAFQVDTSVPGAVTYGFDINVSAINSYSGTASSADWVGAKYGETVGVWAHPFFLADVAFNDDGSYSSLNVLSEGWFDTPLNPTASDPLVRTVIVEQNPVPVPAAIWFFATGLVSVIGIRQRNKKS